MLMAAIDQGRIKCRESTGLVRELPGGVVMVDEPTIGKTQYSVRWHRIDSAVGVPHVIHYQGSNVTKLRRSWSNARIAAGLDEAVTPHTLRHTAATWLMQVGVDMWSAAG